MCPYNHFQVDKCYTIIPYAQTNKNIAVCMCVSMILTGEMVELVYNALYMRLWSSLLIILRCSLSIRLSTDE